ncbi:MAG: DUF6456 domain-containing protein [Rhizobiaceae bacterium]
MSRKSNAQSRQTLRALQFVLAAKGVRMVAFNNHNNDEPQSLLICENNQKRQMVIADALMQQMRASDLVINCDRGWTVTNVGKSHLARHKCALPGENAFGEQHRRMTGDTVMLNGDRQQVRRNLHESPLSRLKLRQLKDGSPWLSDAAYSAGERLRQDFTHAQLSPSVTSNWNAAMGGANGNGVGQGGKVALSDSAMDARRRFNQALASVGPDLTNVLIDICCYLKGLQQVEREQGWPPRSAKLMLRTGLGLLAKFYGTQAGVSMRDGGA